MEPHLPVTIAPDALPIVTDARSIEGSGDDNTYVSAVTAMQGLESEEVGSANAATAALEAPITYCNTGIQTLPPKDAEQFELIYGLEPDEQEVISKIGGAAIGRFTKVANPYEVLYGAPFVAARGIQVIENASYVDANFQTMDVAECKKSLARAKVKASMMVSKQRRSAQAAGYRVWAEPKDEKIIHSEQFGTHVQFDKHGNATSPDTGGLLLPNIYGEEIMSTSPSTHITLLAQRDMSTLAEATIKDDIGTHAYSRTSGLTPPATPPPPPIPKSHSNRISALDPSLREADPDPESIENYGYSRNDSDEVAYQFVVYEATETASPVQKVLSTFSPAASEKRKTELLSGYDTAIRTPNRRNESSLLGVRHRLSDEPDSNARVGRQDRIGTTREESPKRYGGDRTTKDNAAPNRKIMRRRERSLTAESEGSFRASRRDSRRDRDDWRVGDESKPRSYRKRSRSPMDRDRRRLRRSKSRDENTDEEWHNKERKRRHRSREHDRKRQKSSPLESIRETDSKRGRSPRRSERKKRQETEKQSTRSDSQTRGRPKKQYIAPTEERREAELDPLRQKPKDDMKQSRAAEDRRRKKQDELKREREVANVQRLEQNKLKRSSEAGDRRKLKQEGSKQEQGVKKLAGEAMKREREVEDRQRKERHDKRRTRETDDRRRRVDHSTDRRKDARNGSPESEVGQPKKPLDFFAEAREAENRRRLLAQTGFVPESSGRRERSTLKEDERRKSEKKTEDSKVSKPRSGRAPRMELERYDPRKRFGRQ